MMSRYSEGAEGHRTRAAQTNGTGRQATPELALAGGGTAREAGHVHMSRVVGLAAAANLCAAMMIAIAPALGFNIV